MTSQIEAPEETLRRLARERRRNHEEAAAAKLLADAAHIKDDHIRRLVAVLKSLILRYVLFLLTVARQHQLSVDDPKAVQLAPGLVETVNVIAAGEDRHHRDDVITRLFDVETENPLPPMRETRDVFRRLQENIMGSSNPSSIVTAATRGLIDNGITAIGAGAVRHICDDAPDHHERVMREVNHVFRVSKRQIIIAFARCLRNCLREMIVVKQREGSLKQ